MMACKFGFFIIIFLSHRLRKVHGVPEPCRTNVIQDSVIGTMCSASVGKESTRDGNLANDSVILRINNRQENCTCNITIKNQVKNESLVLRKQNGEQAAAPVEDKCGLAVDIRVLPPGPAIQPIQCTQPNQTIAIPLNKGHLLQLKTRFIEGDFTRGYCMQIIRLHKSSDTNLSLEITCEDPPPTKQTTTTFISTSSSTSVITSGLPVTSEKKTTQRKETTQDLTSTKGSIPTTPLPSKTDSTTHILNQTDSQINSEGNGDILYIAIAAGAVVVLLVGIIILVFRIKSKRNQRNKKPDMKSDDNIQDNNGNDEDSLKDNISYKSFDQYTNNHNSKEQTPLTKTCADTFDDYSEIEDTNHTRQHDMTGKSHITTDHYNTIEMDSSQPDNKLIRIEDNYSSISKTDPRTSDKEQPALKAVFGSEINNDHYSKTESRSAHSTNTTPGVDVVNNGSDVTGDKYNKGNTFNCDGNRGDTTSASSNVYAVVNKTDKTSSTKETNDCTSQPEQTYAVVDKSGKQSNSNELKPRPFEPLDTYAVVDKSRENTNLVDRNDESIESNEHDAIMTSGENISSDVHASDDIKTPEYSAEKMDFIAAQSSDYDEIELKFNT